MDFKQCPLKYRFRAIDRIPESPSRNAVRGTVVHAVLEDLFGLPADERDRARAAALVAPAWTRMLAERPEVAELAALWSSPGSSSESSPTRSPPGPSPGATESMESLDQSDAAGAPELTEFLGEVRTLVDNYYELEDPTRFEPHSCEARVEVELADGAPLRGFVDRIDIAPTGQLRVVDYKSGRAPGLASENKALFQLKFYALMMLRTRAIVPTELRLIYLADSQILTYSPDEGELDRFERTLSALWQAILAGGRTGDFPPNTSWLCKFCDYQQLCPAFGGTPPPYPGWPVEQPAAP